MYLVLWLPLAVGDDGFGTVSRRLKNETAGDILPPEIREKSKNEDGGEVRKPKEDSRDTALGKKEKKNEGVSRGFYEYLSALDPIVLRSGLVWCTTWKRSIGTCTRQESGQVPSTRRTLVNKAEGQTNYRRQRIQVHGSYCVGRASASASSSSSASPDANGCPSGQDISTILC